MRSPDQLTDIFHEQGLKVTPQRQVIFRLVHGNTGHPTAESVYEAAREEVPNLSLKTVYQTLNDLAEMGEIQSLDFGTGSSRFDPNVGAHHHLVCTSCGKVRDLDADYSSLRVPKALRQGFQVEDADVVFRGVCGDCNTST